MARPITIAAAAALLQAAYASADPIAAQFADFMHKYNKSYSSDAEEAARLAAFRANVEALDELNAASRAVHGVSKFSDLTPEEFASAMLMTPRAPRAVDRPETSARVGDAPAEFDWNDKGAVTPVKDQGSAGSCWTFSTTGLFEGYYALNVGDLTAFSEEWIVECDDSMADPHADCGVFGGWNDLATEFVLSAGGLPTEADVPYCAGGGDKAAGIDPCYPCTPGIESGPAFDDNWDDNWDDDDWTTYDDDMYAADDYIYADDALDDDDDATDDWAVQREDECGPSPTGCDMTINDATCADAKLTPISASWAMAPEDEDQLLQHLVDNGPISILLDATGLQQYKSGIWDGKGVLGISCTTSELDHAVLLTGYGTDEDGTDYWTIKNSWGTSWGEDGYFRAVRGVGQCGLNTYAVELTK